MFAEYRKVLDSAAIVCAEIAHDGHPIMYAERSAPLQPEDSGWQFLCGDTHANSDDVQIWSVREIVELDPTLTKHILLPAGTILERRSPDAPWVIEKNER